MCMLGLSRLLESLDLFGVGCSMKRAMPSKIDSTSTLEDAEHTLKDASWRNVSKMDKASIRAEIERLQESGVGFRVTNACAHLNTTMQVPMKYTFLYRCRCIHVYITHACTLQFICM